MSRNLSILIYIGFVFLSLGVLTSNSISGLYFVFSIIPFVVLAKYGQMNKSSYFLVVLILISIISVLLNSENITNISKLIGKQKYYLFALLGSLALPSFFKSYMTKKRLELLLKIFFVTIILVFFIGIIKSRFGFDIIKWENVKAIGRSAGLSGIMRYGYGSSLVLTVLVSYAVLSSRVSVISKRWLYTAISFCFLGLIETKCRGALLGFICSIPFILYFKNKKWGKISFVAILTIVLGSIVLMFSGKINSRYFQSLSSPSNLIRISQYQAAILAFKEKPLFGHGINQYDVQLERVKKDNNLFWGDYCQKWNLSCDYSNKKPFYNNHAHNIFLQKLADTGLFGLLALIFFFIYWAKEMLSKNDLVSYITIAFIVNAVVAGQFEYILDSHNSFIIFTWYSLSFLAPKHFEIA